MNSYDRFITIDQIEIPTFFYGTAWKEEKTEQLTYQALEIGFSGIDTANQRKHYHEEGVGRAIKRFLNAGIKKREELFIQTKFTFARGQDHRKPYEENAPYAIQVSQSFQSSLRHLGLEYLDSYLLHGPFTGRGLTTEDWQTWAAMEDLQKEGAVKCLGVSNFGLDQLQELHRQAEIKPSFVQNRCFAASGWDKAIRGFCKANHIQYQGFSLLTANRNELSHPSMAVLSNKHKRTIPQIVFRFTQQIGGIPLTGTSSKHHMQDDLNIYDFELRPDELARIEKIGID
jgi:diketogulonate reductase-like aldo/keto reductase